jgi:IS30 family transposase
LALRHQAKSRLVKLTIECKHLIDNCLNLDWLPEQVCGWLNNFIDANLYATIIAFILKVGENIERKRIFLMK